MIHQNPGSEDLRAMIDAAVATERARWTEEMEDTTDFLAREAQSAHKLSGRVSTANLKVEMGAKSVTLEYAVSMLRGAIARAKGSP